MGVWGGEGSNMGVWGGEGSNMGVWGGGGQQYGGLGGGVKIGGCGHCETPGGLWGAKWGSWGGGVTHLNILVMPSVLLTSPSRPRKQSKALRSSLGSMGPEPMAGKSGGEGEGGNASNGEGGAEEEVGGKKIKVDFRLKKLWKSR